MEHSIVELNGGHKINFEAFLSAHNTIIEKIISLECTLTALENRKSKEEQQEKKNVIQKNFVDDFESKKVLTLEQNLRTMNLEIANLREIMAKDNDPQTTKGLTAKLSCLEAALRLMYEERKKEMIEDKDTLLIRKLALFDQMLLERDEEKILYEAQYQSESGMTTSDTMDGSLQEKPLNSSNTHNDDDDDSCSVCFEQKKDTVFYKCGHLACCNQCATLMRDKKADCPICRAPILDVTKVYQV